MVLPDSQGLASAGAMLLCSTAFYQLAGGLDLQGTSMLESSSSDPSLTRPDADRLRVRVPLHYLLISA